MADTAVSGIKDQFLLSLISVDIRSLTTLNLLSGNKSEKGFPVMMHARVYIHLSNRPRMALSILEGYPLKQ